MQIEHLFKYFSKPNPAGLKREKQKIYDQEYVCFYDNTGAIEVRFNCDPGIITSEGDTIND